MKSNVFCPKMLFLPLIILLLLFKQVSAQQGWQWQYPKPQGNTLRDIYVFNKDTAVAVGDLGTVIKTTNGGNSWDVQHHAGGSSVDLYSVNFTDSQNGWSVGGPSHSGNIVLKTVDGGKNWTSVKTETSLAYHAVYFVDSDTGFIVGEDGIILRTTDGGNKWNMKKIDDYVGQGWLDVYDLWAITFTDTQTGWIVGYGYYWNQIYKTTDCGRTWQWNEGIVNPRVYPSLYDISFSDKNHGCIAGGGLLSTTDGGNTWQQDSVAAGNGYSVFFTDSLNGWTTGNGYMLGTTDGGKNWAEIDSGFIPGYKINKVRFSDKDNGWLVGEEGMLYRTTNGGKNWSAINQKPYQFNSIYFTDENTGWAVGDSGIIMHTTNGGDDWIKQYQNDSLLFNSVYAIDNNNVFAVGAEIKGLAIWDRIGVIFRTTDAGQTWSKQIVDSIYEFNSIYFLNDSTGWLSGTDGNLFKTNNKGNSWIKIKIDSSLSKTSLGKIQFIDINTGWVGSLLKTTDGGNSWIVQNIPSLPYPSSYFINADTGWIVGNYNGGNNIYRTIDGGETWMPSGTPPKSNYYSVYFLNDKTGWVAGGTQLESTIIKTIDGGNTWNIQKAPNKEGIKGICFLNENIGYAVGYDGIFKTSSGGNILLVKKYKDNFSVPKQIELLQNYPNPFNPSTTISYQLTRTGFVSLNVYDILGRLVNVLVSKWQMVGEYTIVWDASKSSSGVYFYRLQINNYNITKKMILIR